MQPVYFPNPVKAEFLARPNRFVVECRLGTKKIRAYLPNPGRLWELLFPGTIVHLVRECKGCSRSTEYTVVAVEHSGRAIMLHTHVNNHVARALIEQGKVPGLEHATVIRREVAIGRSRFDFLLNRNGKEIVLEVKSCTLVGKRIAMFPDAATARGSRHLRELEQIAHEGREAAVLFLVHWPDAEFFMPEWHTDLEFAETLIGVRHKVRIIAVSVQWTRHLVPGRVKPILIPWELIEQEAKDRGSYLFIVKLNRDRRLAIGKLGETKFRKGYYCYVGSAKAGLSRRLERHQRLRKKLFRHIDYLRAETDVHAAIPVRSSEDLECDLAAEMATIADWTIPDFGSTGCDCPSHLFGMAHDPVHTRSFVDLLIRFRMDRLEKYLK